MCRLLLSGRGPPGLEISCYQSPSAPEYHFSPTGSPLSMSSRAMERLQEDVTCSICLDVLEDPVSIECSHNFCRGCLVAHWREVSAQGYQCPECRAPCSRDRMTPDTRLRALVEKITEPLQEEMELQGPRSLPEPGRPVQLVRLDEEGGLILDEEALSRCLEQGGVGNSPVCLVSIIGEQRRGKYFLMNYLLRRLQRPEAEDASWMGQEDQALVGFECRNGTATVTRGVWMWDQPLWVQAQGRRVAVFLVDTEGSLDLERHMETSIRLSVFSILLSSYWIFNISNMFTRTEADYLEIFINVAKEVGETCNLHSFQRLDLLVRDWQLSGSYGLDGGQEFLREKSQHLEASAEQPLVLGALRASGTRCYLLPHPGTGFTSCSVGMPSDMDKKFQQYLCDYITSVMHSAGTHIRKDRAGQVLTGTQLAARIKDVSRYLKTKHYDFSSPMKDRDHQSMRSCLRVKPLEMQKRLEGKRQELLERCRGELLGEDPQKQEALEELQQGLPSQMDEFLLTYKKRFKRKAASLGLYIGGGVLAVVGTAVSVGVGVGVAAAVVTVEEAVAFGVGVGGFSFLGAGAASWFAARFGWKVSQNTTDTNTAGQGNEREGEDRSSDQDPLLQGDR
ncbi:RING finger protein 112-like isoform X5 [Gopherus evgoodei]|uniref:RING finger protein 112-like isoform X5 n=1 Tax=Gopherus evgoodei TaxID=1825980 RepID=UPI0011CEFB08|nr:RING finger protein 112-like isoform X5 [Gopherus evgoodei]